MRLTSAGKPERKNREGILLIAGVAALVVIGIFDFMPPRAAQLTELVVCDAENVDSNLFVNGDHTFLGGQYQSADRARSGLYACKLGGEDMYGLQYDLREPVPRQAYKVTVWASRTGKDRGRLAVSTDDKSLHKEVAIPVQKRDDGWEQLQLYFTVPEDPPARIKIFVYVGQGASAVYFDDLRIEALGVGDQTSDTFPQELLLTMDNTAYRKLEKKKKAAQATGILITQEDDWVDARLTTPGQGTIPVEARLKGDWLDHLQGDKWSLRVEVDDPASWNGMITFSLQSPHTRMFLREWLFHKLLDEVDVLSPRYDFVKLTLNDKYLGIYACEEHFEKHLVESRQRREGPIVKFTEDGFWLGYKRQEDLYGAGTIPVRLADAHWESEVRPFKEKRTRADTQLAEAFIHARNLLYGFKYGELEAGDVFDLDAMARYYAVTDLMQAYHSLVWHNQRFYYNPVTAKLEPIGFDGFGTHIAPAPENRPFLGYHVNAGRYGYLFSRLAASPAFMRKYQASLYAFSTPEWISPRLLNLEGAIDERNELLAEEFANSAMDIKTVMKRVREVRHFLGPKDHISLLARSGAVVDGQKTVTLTNKYCLALDAVGYTGNDQDAIRYFDEPVFVPQGKTTDMPKTVDIQVPSYAQNIVFQLAGVDTLEHLTAISAWSAPRVPDIAPYQALFDITEWPFLEQFGNDVIVRRGNHQVDRDLHLPPGHAMIIEAGTHINLSGSASIIVRGPVRAIGTGDAPIRVTSADGTGQGFTVLGADEMSELRFVQFQGLNTLDRPGWTLTGGVTFYESDVLISNCSFIDSRCEDALNVIRSDVNIDGLMVRETRFDGVDLDFCTGTIANATFHDVQNDALDFSGSVMTVKSCEVFGAGDKGISVGEDATIRVVRAVIENCNIGVASKDLSTLEIDDIHLKHCKQGFTAYQKKPEYGPAYLSAHSYTMEDVKQPYLIEKGSVLYLNGREIAGQ